MSGNASRIDDVTGERIGGATERVGSSPDVNQFRLGVAGYDLWPHAINFCQTLESVDFLKITGVWDDEPRHLDRLVELTGAKG
jgi:hypothetical protein